MKKKAFEILRLLFLGLGLVLLAGIIRKIGWNTLCTQITQLGFSAIPILLVGFSWHVFYVLAWKAVLERQKTQIPFWSLFKVKVIGETVNTLTPANFIGGDPLRIYFLKNLADPTDLAASVAIDRTVNSIAIVAVIFIGAIAAFLGVPGLTPAMNFGIAGFLLLTSALILFLFSRQKKGLFSFLASRFAKKHLAKAQELDEKLLVFYQANHSAFWRALFFHVVGRLLGIVEIVLIGWALAPDFTLFVALILATLAPIINMLFTFIPAALGVMEGAYSGALFLLGLPPSLGLAIQIIKRIRSVLWMGLGLGFIFSARTRQTGGLSGDRLRRPLRSSR